MLKKELIAKAVERNGVKVIAFRGEASVDAIKDLAFQIKGKAIRRKRFSSWLESKTARNAR